MNAQPRKTIYENAEGNISIAAVGDIILRRPVSVFKEAQFLGLVDILRQADATYANLEQTIRRDEGFPREYEAHIEAPPSILEELKWMGIDIVSCANNHSYNYGDGGVLSTIRYLDEAGLPHAGTGRNLAAARAPGYLETAKGRVALISLATPGITEGRAGDQRPDGEGRPGLSMLQPEFTYCVDKQAFSGLRRIDKLLGFEAERADSKRRMGPFKIEAAPKSGEFSFLQTRFAESEGFGVRSVPREDDVSDILRWVREARRSADFVILGVHCHEIGSRLDTPPEFLVTFAHAAIDAGVDIFAGHGPHLLRGIEIYKGKPIYYSLGNFMLQMETNPDLPADVYSALGLGYANTPADVTEVRSNGDQRGAFRDPEFWESVVAVSRFGSHALEKVELYPLVLGFGEPVQCRNRCMLADRETGDEILRKLGVLSEPFGTKIVVKDGIGVISVA